MRGRCLTVPQAVRHLPLTAPDPLAAVSNLLPRPGRCGRRHGGGGVGSRERTVPNRLRSRFDFEVEISPPAANPARCRRARQLRAAPPAPPPDWLGSPARRAARTPHWPLLLRAPRWGGGPHAAPPAPTAPRGAAPPLPPGSRVGHCHTTFQLRTPRCSPPPPPIGSPGPD